MEITQAQRLKIGDQVSFPSDRGEPAGHGRVTLVGSDIQENIYGIKYLWVHVRYAGKARSAVWPSNRLSR